MLDAFLSALGMHTVLLPLIGCEGLQQVKIGFAHDPKLFKNFARTPLCVVTGTDPSVLIEGREGGAGEAENRTHAPADDDFYVAEVSKNFGDRPFVRGRTLAESGQ